MQTGEFDIHIIGTEEISQRENDLSLEELLALPHPLEQHPELLQQKKGPGVSPRPSKYLPKRIISAD